MGFFKNVGKFLTGTPEKRSNVSLLRPEQESLNQQGIQAAQGYGAGGAQGDTADYYRDLMGNDSADLQAFTAPEMRNFNEQIIPGLSEQFAGMGSGGLSSSGFRNAAVSAGTDLSERLGAIRANLRQQGAQGLERIHQSALDPRSQNMVTQQGSEGFLSSGAKVLGDATARFIGGYGQGYGNAKANSRYNNNGAVG